MFQPYPVSFRDAARCGRDLDSRELYAAGRGQEYWFVVFPPQVGPGTAIQGHFPIPSLGHRWGWLIRALGWDKFSGLVSKPAAERQALISSARKAALG